MTKKFHIWKWKSFAISIFAIKEEVAFASTDKSDLAERAHFLSSNLNEMLISRENPFSVE